MAQALGGTASVGQRTLQGQEEADAPKTTSLPASFLFLTLLSSRLSSFSPGQPSMGHLLKNLCFRLRLLGNPDKNMRYQEAQERWCLVWGSGEACLEDELRFEHIWAIHSFHKHILTSALLWSGLSSGLEGHNNHVTVLLSLALTFCDGKERNGNTNNGWLDEFR